MKFKRSITLCFATALTLLAILPAAHAVSLTNFTTDKSSYNAADTGTASLTFLNDQNSLIQITQVDMMFNYFYQDGRVYSQTFTVTGLSTNVTSGSSSLPIAIKFSLPSDVAGGYFTPSLTVTFNLLTSGGTWNRDRQSDLSATKPLYVQSQYVALYQSAQTIQYVFIVATIAAMCLAGYFAMRSHSSKLTPTRSN